MSIIPDKPWQLILHILAVVMYIDQNRHPQEFKDMFNFLKKYIPGKDHKEKNIEFTVELNQAYDRMGDKYDDRVEYLNKLLDSPLLSQKGVVSKIKLGTKKIIASDKIFHPKEKKLLDFIRDSLEAREGIYY